MIGAEDFLADESAFQPRTQGGADEEIIDAPADVPGARVQKWRPPGEMAAVFLELTEGVAKARLHQRAEAGPFLGREPVVFYVGLRVGEVDFSVRHIEVAAENHRLPAFESFEVTPEIAVPPLTIVEPGQFALRVRHIDVDQEKIGELGGEHAAFLVVNWDPDAPRDVERP